MSNEFFFIDQIYNIALSSISILSSIVLFILYSRKNFPSAFLKIILWISIFSCMLQISNLFIQFSNLDLTCSQLTNFTFPLYLASVLCGNLLAFVAFKNLTNQDFIAEDIVKPGILICFMASLAYVLVPDLLHVVHFQDFCFYSVMDDPTTLNKIVMIAYVAGPVILVIGSVLIFSQRIRSILQRKNTHPEEIKMKLEQYRYMSANCLIQLSLYVALMVAQILSILDVHVSGWFADVLLFILRLFGVTNAFFYFFVRNKKPGALEISSGSADKKLVPTFIEFSRSSFSMSPNVSSLQKSSFDF